ncbi:MAG TPA: hypothetical protein VFA20_14255 [Myxococcaceae bacterium]|nr:hypothetical protein [Myxococcaceae bacterium]
MHTLLVTLTVLSMAAGGKPPPAGSSTPPKGGSSSTSPAPLAPTSPPPPASSGAPGAGTSPGPGASSGTPAAANIKPSAATVGYVEALYKKQQFEAADVVLGLALNNPETTLADKVQLHVLEGMLRMESFQEPQARKAFTEAFNLDRDAKLPDFAPPATRQLFLDVKATLPAVITPSPGMPSGSSPGSRPKKVVHQEPPGQFDALLPWIPIGAGAVVAGVGGGFVFASHQVNGSLLTGSATITTPDQLHSAVASGKLYQTTGYTMVGIGGAVLIGGLVWKLAPEVAPLVSVNLAPSDHGVAAVVSGRLP